MIDICCSDVVIAGGSDRDDCKDDIISHVHVVPWFDSCQHAACRQSRLFDYLGRAPTHLFDSFIVSIEQQELSELEQLTPTERSDLLTKVSDVFLKLLLLPFLNLKPRYYISKNPSHKHTHTHTHTNRG